MNLNIYYWTWIKSPFRTEPSLWKANWQYLIWETKKKIFLKTQSQYIRFSLLHLWNSQSKMKLLELGGCNQSIFVVSDVFGFGITVIHKSNQDLRNFSFSWNIISRGVCALNTESCVAWCGWFTKVIQVLATVMLGLETSRHISRVCNYAYLPVM